MDTHYIAIVGCLIRENNIISKTVRKFKATTNSNHNYPVAKNILNFAYG